MCQPTSDRQRRRSRCAASALLKTADGRLCPPPAGEGESCSERNLVIHVGAGAGPRAGGRGDFAGRSGRAELAATVFAEIRAPATGTGTGATGAVEQCQFAAKALQHDLGRIAILAGLVLPFARLQRTLDENLRALFQILLGDPAQILVEDDDAVPFGFFAPLAGGLVFP